jgi:hypothetical protein
VRNTGGELERRPENAPVPYVQAQHQAQHRGEAVGIIDWLELAAWVRRRGVVLGGLGLVAAEVIWKAVFLSHYYFWQDDFHFLEQARAHSFTWSYLTYVQAGHLFPGLYALFWVVVRVSPYNWGLAAGITVVLVAASGLAAFRLLRTLFGTRPAILVPLLVYVLTPLTFPNIRDWSSGLESLPLQLATFMALTSQVHYVRTRRLRHAVAAAVWVAFGLLFFEKALALPLLLVAVTSGFLVEGRWLPGVWRCLVTYWRGWAMQAAVLVGYAVMFAYSLGTSSNKPGAPGSASAVFSFTLELIKSTFVPGAIGGPWQWFPTGDQEYAYSSPPPALAWLSLIVAAVVVAASIWLRRYAWRAWAILAGWLVIADITPVLIGRTGVLGSSLFGLETRYVADAAPVLAICLGLAFWPPAGQPDRARGLGAVAGLPQWGQWARTAAAGLVGAFVIGSLWSVQAFQSDTSTVQVRLFVANAQLALSEAPRGTVIADSRPPTALMEGIFENADFDSQVLGVLGHTGPGAATSFTKLPAGTIDNLMIFASDGRLHQAALYGTTSVGAAGSCQRVRHRNAVVRFAIPTWSTPLVLKVPYVAGPSVTGDTVTVTYGTSTQQFTVQRNLHAVYFQERGSVSSVTLSGPGLGSASGSGMCVGQLQAGIMVPSQSGTVIPPLY